MEPFLVLGHHVNAQVRRELAHSALPDAPIQPYVPRRRTRRRTARHTLRWLADLRLQWPVRRVSTTTHRPQPSMTAPIPSRR